MTDTTDIAALRPSERAKLGFVTDDNTGGYYVAECEECGQIFPSQNSDGGEQIADTGDYGDCYCPHCGHIDPQECDNANLVWNVQQLKIINLTNQLAALKSEQAPVAWHHATLALAKSDEDKKSLPAQVAERYSIPLFTGPQKPVVHLKSGYLHKSEVIDALEAAGCIVSFSDERLMQDMSGIVKDGE